MPPKVWCIGETVLDILFRDGQPVSATPGGSALNSAVDLGRSGIRVEFISETGNDQAGDLALDFLKRNHVGTAHIRRFDPGKTAVSLAFLDQTRNARYSFYRDYPPERLAGPLPSVKKGDVILFGSIYAITPGLHTKITDWIEDSKRKGAVVLYDPNFRKAHLGMLETALPMIRKNIGLADLVRGSDEDFQNIFGIRAPEKIRSLLPASICPNLILTRGENKVIAWFGKTRISHDPEPLKKVVSTIGAGDAFNAGIVYAFLNNAGSLFRTGEAEVKTAETLLSWGNRFSSDVCTRLENCISEGLIKSCVS